MVFQIKQNGELWAFKVWHTDLNNIKYRYEKIENQLSIFKLPYFVEFAYVEKGIVVDGTYIDTHRMKWIEGLTLNEYITQYISEPHRFLEIANKFKQMVSCFHKHGIAHGDLQHGNIIVKKDESLIVIDYDSMYVKDLKGMPDIIKGQAGYQHPGRYMNINVNEKLD